MQEEVEHRSVTLIINSAKFSGRVLKAAISKYMAHRRNVRHEKKTQDVTPHGKMSVKQLAEQNQGLNSFEMQKDDGIKQFEHVCRKYGVDYAVRKVKGDNPKYVVFFKGRDQDAIKSAFTEFMDKQVKKKNRQPLRKQLAGVMPLMNNRDPNKERNKHQEHSR